MGKRYKPKRERSWLDYLAELNRLQYALQEGLFDFDPEKSALEYLYKPLPPPAERPSFEKYLEREGVMPEGWGRTLFGFVGDVAMDPLTWGAGRLVTRPVGKVAAALGRQAAKVPALAKAGETASKLFIHPAKRIGKAHPGFLKLWRRMAGEESQIAEAWAKQADDFVREARRIAKQKKISLDDVMSKVTEVVERPKTPASPEIRKLAERVSGAYRQMLKGEQLVMRSPELQAEGVEYFRRIATPKGLKWLEEAGLKKPEDLPSLIRKNLPEITGKRGKAFENMTISEINRLMEPKVGGKLFYEDIGRAVAERGAKSARAISKAQFIRNVVREFGDPKGVPLSGEIIRRVGDDLKGAKLPPEIAGYVNKMWAAIDKPEGTKAVVRLYDSLLGLWKRWTLLPFPAYHVRNVIGNLWNNWLVGVSKPKWYSLAMDVQKGAKRTVKLGGKVYKLDDLRQIAVQNKVLGRGFMAVESALKHGADDAGRAARAAKLLSDNPLLRAGAAVGQAMEDNARLANFLYHLDKGLKPHEAASKVAMTLFNYDETPEFISDVAVRLMPFFRWTYFNLPYQLKMLALRPGKFIAAAKLPQAIARRTKPVKGVIPPFIAEGLGVPVRDNEDGTQSVFLMRSWIPAADIAEVVKPFVELVKRGPQPAFREALQPFLERLSPFIKAPAEYAANWSIFFRRPIEEYPGQKTEFMGLKLTRHQANLIKNIRILNEFDRSFPWEIFGMERPHRVDLPMAQRLMRFLLGFKLYPVSRKRAEAQAQWERMRELAAARKAVKMAEYFGDPAEIARVRRILRQLEAEGKPIVQKGA